eukprot:3446012-Amphidinium_carterae.1
MPWHYDLKNCGDSWVVSCGRYSGGFLELEGLGPVDTNLNWVKIPQGCRHKVHPLRSGIRISFVFYTPQSLHLLPRSDLELLQQCGFPVSATLQTSRNHAHVSDSIGDDA